MLKKCTEAFSKMPSTLLLTQRAFTQAFTYRFSINEKERTKQNSVRKDRTVSEKLKLQKIHFSISNSNHKEQLRVSENWGEQDIFELSLQQKLYFIQAAGLLFIVNILVRLSMDNKSHIDSYKRNI